MSQTSTLTIAELARAKRLAFEQYRALLAASSPTTRTPGQQHEIDMARSDALTARWMLEKAEFWARSHARDAAIAQSVFKRRRA